MTAFIRLLFLFALALGLVSCDSIKNKAKAVLDEKIAETEGGGEVASTDSADAAEAPAASGPTDIDDEIGDPKPATPGLASPQKRVRSLSSAEFDSFTKLSGHVVVVDFYADWCGPCKRLAPVLDKVVAANQGKVLLGKVDVDKHGDLAQREGVRGIPDVRIFVNGKQVDRFVGMPAEPMVKKTIESHLGKIAGSKPVPKPKPPAPKPPAPKPTDKPGDKPPGTDKPAEPGKGPAIKPMDKDWLPPGMKKT